MKRFAMPAAAALLLAACEAPKRTAGDAGGPLPVVKPRYVTEKVRHDTDDPAIWVNPADPAQSLILGTDKDADGALYVFDLQGRIIPEKTVRPLRRPNNVDLEYGFLLGGVPTDIAVVTERMSSMLRIYAVPDMRPVDGGGIPVFEGEAGPEHRDLMGIALYKQPATGEVYAIVGRKQGPQDGTYLWQYRLADAGGGRIGAVLVRKFGAYSGLKEIEAIAVDDSLGYVYYSDEQAGIRKYHADPARGNEELAFFGQEGFAEDHEGISLYAEPGGAGWLIVSDQGADRFRIYTRQGPPGQPHAHQLVRTVRVAARESDGSETIARPMGPDFPRGLFVAMSTDRTFHLYRWEDLAE
ncbi:MAG: phytase [Bacteroidia bacterium]|nr:phytase [Bacteroidia bacterium]